MTKPSPALLTRRAISLALPFAIGAGLTSPAAAARTTLVDIEAQFGGRLGVFALDTGSGRALSHRGGERFLMCSTFKGLLAAQVLARVDAAQDSLTDLVPYTERDLIFTSPVTKENVDRGALSVGDLCRAILETSDNTAAILLMRRCGGPESLTGFVRSLGDDVTRSDRYEPASNESEGPLDTTTPEAMAHTVRSILLGSVLKPRMRDWLEAGMVACKPGLQRIRAALPPGWGAGDRPGTNLSHETNDCALIRPPGRAPLVVAAYYDAPGADLAVREDVLRRVGATLVAWAGMDRRT